MPVGMRLLAGGTILCATSHLLDVTHDQSSLEDVLLRVSAYSEALESNSCSFIQQMQIKLEYIKRHERDAGGNAFASRRHHPLRNEFPGSQPVSLSSENWDLLSKQRYDLQASKLCQL